VTSFSALRRFTFALVVAPTILVAGVIAGCKTDASQRATRQASTQSAPVPRSDDVPDPVRARSNVDEAIADGVAFLVKSQNPDGSWGTGVQTRGTEIYSMVPGSHDAYRVGTTALCVMALREAGETEAHARGVDYLVRFGDARRDDGPLMYNTWAHIYALQALAGEMKGGIKSGSTPELKAAAERQLQRMVAYETYLGGWNYYDFRAQTQKPSLAPTSFQTAAALVAMYEAREAGIDVPQALFDRAMRRVEECRLPDGSYLYGSDYKYALRSPANKMNGSIGRQQSNNYALWLNGSKQVGKEQSLQGLKNLFERHQWIEMGRKRPFPHEAWYQTSGYYFYFAHYYAARIIERIDDANRPQAVKALADIILPLQEADGSWWDYAMWDYHKPYGTAYAVMTLVRCKAPPQAPPQTALGTVPH
jgi:hypothetical protein